MEEIDIIELLQRVKEGKAPKRIEIHNAYYEFYENYETFEEMYNEIEFDVYWHIDAMNFDTKIKILDKPIINTVDELKKIIKDKDSIFWIGERGLMAIEGAINIIQNKEEK